jgi:hypothetical protein
MGQPKPTSSKGLAIRIDNEQEVYRPGDVISGHVYRQVPIIVGERDVTVTVRFGGRSVVSMSGWLDNTSDNYAEREATFEIIDPNTTLQTLHKGPLNIPRTAPGLPSDAPDAPDKGDGKWWPFSVTIPAQTSAESTIDDMFYRKGLDRSESTPEYIPADKNRKATAQDLLPSLRMSGTGAPGYGVPGLGLSGRVYYFIEATLVSGGSNNRPVSLVIVHLDPNPAASVTTPNIHHSNQTLSLSFGRILKTNLDVSFQISTPTVYSLREDAPLSLSISATWPTDGSAQKFPSTLPQRPDITVESFSVVVEQIDKFWAGPDYLSRGEEFCITAYKPRASTAELPDRVMIPHGSAEQALDLGRLFNIKLGAVIEMNGKTEEISQLHASFATYNLKRSYRLAWDVGVKVKGIVKTISGKEIIELI